MLGGRPLGGKWGTFPEKASAPRFPAYPPRHLAHGKTAEGSVVERKGFVRGYDDILIAHGEYAVFMAFSKFHGWPFVGYPWGFQGIKCQPVAAAQPKEKALP